MCGIDWSQQCLCIAFLYIDIYAPGLRVGDVVVRVDHGFARAGGGDVGGVGGEVGGGGGAFGGIASIGNMGKQCLEKRKRYNE